MKKLSKILLFSMLAVFLVGGSVWATPFNTRPTPIGDATSLAELQGVFSDIDSTLDVISDQSTAAIFIPMAGGTSSGTYAATISWGWSGGIEFGLYEYGDTNNRLMLFDGTAPALPTVGDSVSIIFDTVANEVRSYDEGGPIATAPYFYNFGFYAFVPSITNGPFFSEDDQNDNGYARFLTYAGLGDDVTIGSAPPGSDAGHWYVAPETGIYGRPLYPPNPEVGDFSDFVVLFESIEPVPIPPAALLLASGLLGLIGIRRFKKRG